MSRLLTLVVVVWLAFWGVSAFGFFQIYAKCLPDTGACFRIEAPPGETKPLSISFEVSETGIVPTACTGDTPCVDMAVRSAAKRCYDQEANVHLS